MFSSPPSTENLSNCLIVVSFVVQQLSSLLSTHSRRSRARCKACGISVASEMDQRIVLMSESPRMNPFKYHLLVDLSHRYNRGSLRGAGYTAYKPSLIFTGTTTPISPRCSPNILVCLPRRHQCPHRSSQEVPLVDDPPELVAPPESRVTALEFAQGAQVSQEIVDFYTQDIIDKIRKGHGSRNPLRSV